MSVPSMAGQPVPARRDRGHTLGVWSLLMVPLLLVSGAVGGIVGFVLLGMKDLEGSEPMSEQGAWGWMVFALSTLILMVPMIVGIVLGVKARKLGERRLGTIGVAVCGATLVAYTVLSTLNVASQ